MKHLQFRLTLTDEEIKNTPSTIPQVDDIIINSPKDSQSAYQIVPGSIYKSGSFKVDYILDGNKVFPQNYGYIERGIINYLRKSHDYPEMWDAERAMFLNVIIIKNETIVVGEKVSSKPIGIMEINDDGFKTIYIICLAGDYLGVISSIFDKTMQKDTRLKDIRDFHLSFNPNAEIKFYNVQSAARVMSFTTKLKYEISEYLRDTGDRFKTFWDYASYIDRKYGLGILEREVEIEMDKEPEFVKPVESDTLTFDISRQVMLFPEDSGDLTRSGASKKTTMQSNRDESIINKRRDLQNTVEDGLIDKIEHETLE